MWMELPQGLPEGGSGGTMTPGPMGFRGQREGPLGFIGPVEIKDRRPFFFGRSLENPEKIVLFRREDLFFFFFFSEII